MIELLSRSTPVVLCALLFTSCGKSDAPDGQHTARACNELIAGAVAAARAGNFNESRRLLSRLSDLAPDRSDANAIVSAMEDAFRSLPLESGNPAGDWEMYRCSCEVAEMMMDAIWRLTNSPDSVIDFICLQRGRYDEIAEDCQRRYRELLRRENCCGVDRPELVRLHNLRCNYIHSITVADESTLFSVISNKFFSSERREFDVCMDRLKKALGRNVGLDEQLRLLYPQTKIGTGKSKGRR